MSRAFPYLSESFSFIAGRTWVQSFKRRHRIRQRMVTKFVSKNDVATLEDTVKAAENFQQLTRKIIPNFPLDFVINTDQTGCQYQMVFKRSLEFQGSKTVFVKKQNLNKITHSYTAQYTITASGKLLPYVFLCMQETNGTFGVRVKKTVEKLTQEYGNVVITCSKSGKLTKALYKDYLTSTLKPYVKDNKFLILVDSWGGQVDNTLYDEVFQNDEGEWTCTMKVIPPKCTPLCQPCDVYFYRQVKNFIKKIQNASDLLQQQREVASREDAIKIHSLLLHQLRAPIFCDMIKYAWFASKLITEKPLFQNVNEVCFPLSLTKTKCFCGGVNFIQCALCQSTLCFKCFYDEYHPKKCTGCIIHEESDEEML